MTAVYDRFGVTVYAGDCLDVLPEMPDNSLHAVCTDPPYGLEFMGKEWDSFRPSSARLRTRVDGRTNPTEGKSVTTTPEAYVAGEPFEQWCRQWAAECLRVLKPGGHLVAFGGSRTWHRLTAAIEDAGFEIRDSIAWMYASGFPKSLDVSKAIDNAAGAEREVLGIAVRPTGNATYDKRPSRPEGLYRSPEYELTAPATPDAQRWTGWGTALKPGHEPIVWARKPFSPVPWEWRLVADVHHALAGLLWLSLSPARRAAPHSASRNPEPSEVVCASARVNAALATSPARSVRTATFSSPALESTCWNIAGSWSGILAALSGQTKTCTTLTRSSTTTALKTLCSLLAPVTSPSTMPPCGCLVAGSASNAPNAGNRSTGEWANWLYALSASVPETAIEGIALAVCSALASIADDLLSGQEAVSTAEASATTPAAVGGSPAIAPIVVARKPLTGTVAANALEHGTGALNIDGCRVQPTPGDYDHPGNDNRKHTDTAYNRFEREGRQTPPHAAGRWPSNVVLTHAVECAESCVDGCPVAELDRQSGISPSNARVNKGRGLGYHGADGERGAWAAADDAGGASRFFPAFRFEAKAPSSERPRVNGVAHPTVKPLALMRWLVRLVTPPGGTVLDPFLGSGTTAQAARAEGFRCIGIERDESYLPLIRARLDTVEADLFEDGEPA